MLKILRTTLGDGFETDATMFGKFLEKATGRPLNVEGFPGKPCSISAAEQPEQK
jgi:hypothetical protein